ncbi:O112ab family O-antigen polymerase [Escherichia coli]
MVNAKNFVLIIFDVICLFFNVFIYVPRLIIGVLTVDKTLIITFPLMLSVLAYNFIPPETYDLYRHYENYQNFLNNNEVSFIRDFFLYFLFTVGRFFDLNNGFIAFVSCYILYFYWLKILYINFDYKAKKKNSPLYFLIFFITPPLVIYTGVRFSTGLILTLYGIVNWIQLRNVKLGIVYIICGLTAHFSMALIALIFIFTSYFNNIFSNKYLRVGFVFSALLVISFNEQLVRFLTTVIEFINQLFDWNFISIDTYITGKWGLERAQELNSTGQLVLGIRNYGMLFLILLFCPLISFNKNKYTNFYYVMCAVTILVFPFTAVFDRYGTFLIFFIVYYLSTLQKKTNIEIIYFLTLIVYLIFFRAIDIKDNISVYTESYSNILNLSLIKVLLGI